MSTRRLAEFSQINVQTRNQIAIPMANWDNSVFDTSFMLSLITGEYTYVWPLVEYLNIYINADGGKGIGCDSGGLALRVRHHGSLQHPLAIKRVRT